MRAVPSIDQRLIAITGQVPLVDWQTNGVTAQSLALNPAAIATGAPRTVYTVFWVGSTSVANGASSGAIVQYGNDSTTNNDLYPRFNLPPGSTLPSQWLVEFRQASYAGINPLQANTMGCVIGGIDTNGYVWQWNGTAKTTGTVPCPLVHNQMMVYAPSTGLANIQTKGQRTVVYAGVHDVAAMTRVKAWLLRSTILL